MAKRHSESVTVKPPPSALAPWLVILSLLVGIVFVYQWALRRPAEKLLGGPPPPIEYLQYLTAPPPVAASSAESLPPVRLPAAATGSAAVIAPRATPPRMTDTPTPTRTPARRTRVVPPPESDRVVGQ